MSENVTVHSFVVYHSYVRTTGEAVLKIPEKSSHLLQKFTFIILKNQTPSIFNTHLNLTRIVE